METLSQGEQSSSHRSGSLEPGLGERLVQECLVTRPLPLGSGWAKPGQATWVFPPVGPPLAGGSILGSGRRWGLSALTLSH